MEIPVCCHQPQEGPFIWSLENQARGNIPGSIRPSGLGASGIQAKLFASKSSAISGNPHSLLNFWKIKYPPLNHNLRVHEVKTNHVYPPLLSQEVQALCTSTGNMSSIENILKPMDFLFKETIVHSFNPSPTSIPSCNHELCLHSHPSNLGRNSCHHKSQSWARTASWLSDSQTN